ncbi:GNAT family N-acetyltransferase [Cellulomonas alba]|uniref:GNAT family N-acetyltransferase n=1 Tax=Cellulomonas alba TaxID=3053467 RepID=A0ABT7SF98_9CELL|nr:GNAT family N-acetyltransferase [Cellulomonas alba]MDM7854847.1 GNAT family N-acetyltransferase [Cellulomonas alba]
MTTWSIDPLPVPDGPDDPGLRELAHVTNAVDRELWGSDDFRRTTRELLESLRDDPYERHVVLGARDGGALLGYALLHLPRRENTHTGALELGVLPEHRRRGIGTALHAAALAHARADGRTRLTASTDQRVEPAPGTGTLAPPTGEGLVAADDAGVRFARRHGWDLEQVARYSVLDVPRDGDAAAREHVARLRADAEAHAGPDYRLLAWSAPTPADYAEQFAALQTEMSADDPHAGFEQDTQEWDAERVRRGEQTWAAQGRALLVMCAEHVPTRTLAAYTDLLVPDEPGEYVHQYDTLVARAHRGRRLGMLVKTANVQRLVDELPAVRRIGTWNAEENRWMLAINVALGFRPAGGSGEWQLRLDGRGDA